MAPRNPWPFQRTVERHSLGTHAGWTTTAVVEDRGLRLRAGFASVEVGRRRARRVEARRGEDRVTGRIPRAPEPWVEATLAIVVLWVVCATVLAAARWLRG